MTDKQLTINDPNNYYKLTEPFDGAAEAETAVEKFWEELYALRNKYELPDVLVVLCVPIRYEDGDVGNVLAKLHAGADDQAEAMAAWLYGRVANERQERMAKVIDMSMSVRARASKK